jgi:hypothetical protein
MSSESLSSGTSTYHIQYDPPPRTRSSSPSESSRDHDDLPLIEALSDPIIWEASRARNELLPGLPPLAPIRYPGRRVARPRTPRVSSLRAMHLSENEVTSSAQNTLPENCDYPPPSEAGLGTTELTTAPTPPPFTVTWESEDDGDADSTSYPSRRDHSSSDEDAEESAASLYRLNGLTGRRPARRSSPGRIELRDAGEVEQILQPHARFFIGKNRNKITIKFDPPV